MKKYFVFLCILVIGLVIVDIFFTKKFIFIPHYSTIQNISFDNSCQKDSDCVLQVVEMRCEAKCWYDDSAYESVNIKNFLKYQDSWLKSNCIEGRQKLPTCSLDLPPIKVQSKPSKAVCRKNICQKVVYN